MLLKRMDDQGTVSRQDFNAVVGKGLAALVSGALYVCAAVYESVSLPPDDQKRLELVDKLVESYFTEGAKAVLRKFPLGVYRHDPSVAIFGNTPSGSLANGRRYVNYNDFRLSRNVEDIVFHESMHCLEKAGLIDRVTFVEVYDKLLNAPPEIPLSSIESELNQRLEQLRGSREGTAEDLNKAFVQVMRDVCRAPGFYVTKTEVERILKKYDPKHADMLGERIAHVATLWRLSFYDIPDDLQAVFHRVINLEKRGIPGRGVRDQSIDGESR